MKKYILTALLLLIAVSVGMTQTNFIRHEPVIPADSFNVLRPLLKQHSQYMVYGTIPDTFLVCKTVNDTSMAYKVWNYNTLMFSLVGGDSIRIICKGGYIVGTNNYVAPLCTLNYFKAVKDTTQQIWVLPEITGIRDMFFIFQPYYDPVKKDSIWIRNGYISRDRY